MEKQVKRRQFHESSEEEADKNSSQSHSPSPPLPSRLDRIASPVDTKKKAKQKRSDSNNSKDVEKIQNDKKERQIKDKSPKRQQSRSNTPSRKRSRSRSRSPRRKKSTPPRRRRSRSRSRSKDRRRRSRSRDRRRRSRSRSKDRRRSRSRNHRRSRSPRWRRFSRSRSPSPQFTSKWGMKRDVTRAVLPEGGEKKYVFSTKEVEFRVAQHMKSVQERAKEEAKNINLPGYLNPAMVNIHQFKQVQDKRKLLWSKTKDKKEGATQYAGGATDEKFKRLMGIQDIDVQADETTIQKSRQVLNDLEREYEKSRAFQLSRGAGGITGMGLGFGSQPGQP